jgi:hypothetical protein
LRNSAEPQWARDVDDEGYGKGQARVRQTSDASSGR